MQVIGFFGSAIQQMGALWAMISTPLGNLDPAISMEPFKSASILSLLSVSLVSTLLIVLVFRIIRLFVGG